MVPGLWAGLGPEGEKPREAGERSHQCVRGLQSFFIKTCSLSPRSPSSVRGPEERKGGPWECSLPPLVGSGAHARCLRPPSPIWPSSPVSGFLGKAEVLKDKAAVTHWPQSNGDKKLEQ